MVTDVTSFIKVLSCFVFSIGRLLVPFVVTSTQHKQGHNGAQSIGGNAMVDGLHLQNILSFFFFSAKNWENLIRFFSCTFKKYTPITNEGKNIKQFSSS